MRGTQQLRISLPSDMVQMVRARVANGDFASESDVIREGLQALTDRDASIESWLKATVAPAFDAMMTDPSTLIDADDVFNGLREHHQRAMAKPGP
jgi:antitoxin ParD1/3/4